MQTRSPGEVSARTAQSSVASDPLKASTCENGRAAYSARRRRTATASGSGYDDTAPSSTHARSRAATSGDGGIVVSLASSLRISGAASTDDAVSTVRADVVGTSLTPG